MLIHICRQAGFRSSQLHTQASNCKTVKTCRHLLCKISIIPSHLHHTHLLISGPPSDGSAVPTSSLSVCCPAPSHPLFPDIRTNLLVANALVLAIHRAELQINVLLPWHRILVALGSIVAGWPMIIMPFISQQLQRKPTSLKTYKIHNGLQYHIIAIIIVVITPPSSTYVEPSGCGCLLERQRHTKDEFTYCKLRMSINIVHSDLIYLHQQENFSEEGPLAFVLNHSDLSDLFVVNYLL